MSIDEAPTSVTSWTSVHGSSAATREQHLAIAWDRVARDARLLVAAYERTRVATASAYHSPTGQRRDRVWFPVWLLTAHQPRRKGHVDTVDGRAIGTTTLPEVPGIALLADACLTEFVLVKRDPMLTVPLRQARPGSPPPHAMFVALMGQIPH